MEFIDDNETWLCTLLDRVAVNKTSEEKDILLKEIQEN